MPIKLAIYCILCLAGMLIAASQAPSSGENGLAARIIVINKPDGLVEIKPACLAKRSVKISYFLDLIKQGGSGNSVSRQSGTAFLKPNQEAVLCEVALNLQSDSRCRVLLKVFCQGRVIARKEIEISGSNRGELI